jgi:hypothetical protein
MTPQTKEQGKTTSRWGAEAEPVAPFMPEQQTKRDSSLRSERVTLFRETRILSRKPILFSIAFRAKSKKSQPLRMRARKQKRGEIPRREENRFRSLGMTRQKFKDQNQQQPRIR